MTVKAQVGEGRPPPHPHRPSPRRRRPSTVTIEDNGIGIDPRRGVATSPIARPGSLEFFKAYADAAEADDPASRFIGTVGGGLYATSWGIEGRVRTRFDALRRDAGGVAIDRRRTFTVLPGDRESPRHQVVLTSKTTEGYLASGG